jgi:hypothetical protein
LDIRRASLKIVVAGKRDLIEDAAVEGVPKCNCALTHGKTLPKRERLFREPLPMLL